MSDAVPVLAIHDARKSFGAVLALEDVSLELYHGEVVAVLGDNGAGKSTLIKILSGVHEPDVGQMYMDGEPVSFRSPTDARAAGIETVYQDLALFDNLTAHANFFVGHELTRPKWAGRLGIVSEKRMEREWRVKAADMRVGIKDGRQALGLLSGGQRQAVAVARSVAFARRVVILDEPTAALGVRESGEVLRLISGLKDLGISVILISHNLAHVTEVADRAIVLRQGKKVGEAEAVPAEHENLVSMIVGAMS